MPQYFFHLHAGESRANPDNTGQHLPDLDAARKMAQRIARRLLEWNLEPVPWLDYQVHVTDKAGAMVCRLALSEVVDLPARTETEAVGSLDQGVMSEAEDKGLLNRLDAEISSLLLETRPITRPDAPVLDRVEQPRTALALPCGLGSDRWGGRTSRPQVRERPAVRERTVLSHTGAAKRGFWKPWASTKQRP